jgi:isoleucyl-tRNA synthetase
MSFELNTKPNLKGVEPKSELKNEQGQELKSELDVLKFWKDEQIFEKSLQNRKGAESYIFLDGPPFATGLPHWGHILVSQVKDSVLRYWTQKGFYVPRRWGWDCHGNPIEVLAQKELEITDKRQIDNEIGVAKFNKHCRNLVMLYDYEWRSVIERIGRWVDFDNQYRTMDDDFIESVWWGLGQLWNKGLVYKDYRISLYSPSVGVPLTHTDIAMEVQYKEEVINTPVVEFKIKDESVRKLLKKVLDEVDFNTSEQLRYKTDLEKRIEGLTRKTAGLLGAGGDIANVRKNNFEGLDWERFKTSDETDDEVDHLKEQYSAVLENLDTLERLRKILSLDLVMSILAWTTTPWTLPANVALAVGEEIEYSLFYLSAQNRLIVLAESKAVEILSKRFVDNSIINSPEIAQKLESVEDSSEYFAVLGLGITKIASFTGSDLQGLEYYPLFEINQKIESLEQMASSYKVYVAPFVTAEEGTGIVHIAPAYGAEDFELKQAYNLPVLVCLNAHGELLENLNSELKPLEGKYFEQLNKGLMNQLLDKKEVLFTSFDHRHKVPIYDRDGKKVYYSVQDSWFIAETRLKTRSLELLQQTNWVPENLKEGRFGKGLETAPDWSISRSRYWGTPLPIWQNQNKTKTIFVDSIDKLYRLAVNPIYRVFNTTDFKQEIYEGGKAVIITDSQAKLPLGVNATQYRSKTLTEMRREKAVLDITSFAEYGQRLLDDILKLFEKYRDVQLMFNPEEQRLWTTWLLNLHPESQKNTKIFYFFRRVQEQIENFEPVGLVKMLDLHRPNIDEIILKDEVGNIYYRNIEVLDGWVDSGSMPFASWHYPFENQEMLEKSIPAQWITESMDQTRGWFRTLHVLSCGIFDKPAFKNVNTNGLVMASDGKKMSKSKKNFSDPMVLLDKFGADSLRAYMLSSPILNGENLNFSDKDLETFFRNTTLILGNVGKYASFVFEQHPLTVGEVKVKHLLNKWWIARTQNLVVEVAKYMDNYQISEAFRLIVPYIEELSTWYIRRSKDLLQNYGQETSQTLHQTLDWFCRACASLQPFNTERLWSLIKKESDFESVHLTDFPAVEELSEKQLEYIDKMVKIKELVSQVHSIRKEREIRVRQPLYVDLSGFVDNISIREIICDECNLIEHSLKGREGEMFENQSRDFGLLKIDLVVDQELSVLGFVRDFERAVQDFRKKQGFKTGEVVNMKWELTEVKDMELLDQVLKKMDWAKLNVDVHWSQNLNPKLDTKFVVKDLVVVLVD